VFSGLDSSVAGEIEGAFAQAGHIVVSNSRNYRMEADVPLLIPPVNAQHATLVRLQQKRRAFKGFIVPIPNCTATGLAITLAAIDATFGVSAVLMTSLQAVSGAGRSPGVIALDILDNVIPHISKEEGKVELETKKILGSILPGQIGTVPHSMKVSCTCTRVAVLEGHTECVYVSLRRKASVDQVAQAMRQWKGEEAARKLPADPRRPAPPILRLPRNRPVITASWRVRNSDCRRST